MDPRRSLPSVDRVLRELPDLPHALALEAARAAVDQARERLGEGHEVSGEAVLDDARRRVDEVRRSLLQPLINATGVLLHTNLGRAPLGDGALAAVAAVSRGYTNLEFRLEDGRRGSRRDHAGPLLARACGAAAALVVNNNAGAVILALATLARGREVVVSRGELVEIGGGFRIPEIMAESGARLVEVGTTNRTRRRDYAAACSPDTALVLKVHPSNYRMVGFVEEATVAELASLPVPVMVDAGSGLLDEATPWLPRRPPWLSGEPGVRQCLEAGAALVTFSGDKLLGGPQAGVLAGRADLVEAAARHPLARALRPDKMTLAALEATALAYLDGQVEDIPFWRLATTPVEDLVRRSRALCAQLEGARLETPGLRGTAAPSGPPVEPVLTDATAGGGSLPGLTIPSAGVAVDGEAGAVLDALRRRGVIGRADAGRAVLDLRSVEPDDDPALARAVLHLLGLHPLGLHPLGLDLPGLHPPGLHPPGSI